MAIKFSHVYTKGDKIKIAILLIVATVSWIIVWREYKKPMNIDWQTSVPRATATTE